MHMHIAEAAAATAKTTHYWQQRSARASQMKINNVNSEINDCVQLN